MKPTNLLTTTLLLPLFACSSESKVSQDPNVIIIFTDDQGFNDLGCYGSPLIKTPNLDAMAQSGVHFTDFYVSSSISSPSRAGLLTGKYNTHNGVPVVFWPGEKGMAQEEITIAEALKTKGYNTACIGKWHLGDADGYLPTEQGFDEYLGIPYSNDMNIAPQLKVSENVVLRDGFTLDMLQDDKNFADTSQLQTWVVAQILKRRVPLLEGDEVVEFPCDQASLTRRYFDRAIDFIERCDGEPFFAYITPAMPHYPLSASEEFKGKSERGLYGDVVEEIDFNVGRLLSYLEERAMSENTLVIFASDNGPWEDIGEDAGSAAPLRGAKFSLYEGGVRVPCIMQWKGVIPENSTCTSISTSIDIFPTIMHYAGVTTSHEIDGVNMASVLENPKESVRDEYQYVRNGKLSGIRCGDWVYLENSGAAYPAADAAPELFNLKEDISQSTNLYDQYPEKVSELKARLAEIRSEEL